MGIDKFDKPLVRFPEDEDTSFEEVIVEERQAKEALERISQAFDQVGLSLSKDTKILEGGTGTGVLMRYLKKEGYDTVGVDARPRHGEALPIATARIERLPFADASFGAIISSAIFDEDFYIQDQGSMRKEIARVLEPEGFYIALYSSGNDIEGFQTTLRSRSLALALYRKRLA